MRQTQAESAVVIALGIDCATRTGWALVESARGRERLLECGVLDLARPDAWNPVAWLALHCRAPKPAPDVVAIELPWMGKNAHTLEVLARLCGRFEQAFEAQGCPVVLVRAKTWQTAILTGLITTTSKREQCKRAARTWCKATFGVDLDEDRADAVGIATWALRTARARAVGLVR
ncbi:MAG TPA: hypothetical protein VJ801_17625 [Polyangia bacterium]|jgi:hypothetical protein|nr:hypothetical protein [Polyangia bacterium]